MEERRRGRGAVEVKVRRRGAVEVTVRRGGGVEERRRGSLNHDSSGGSVPGEAARCWSGSEEDVPAYRCSWLCGGLHSHTGGPSDVISIAKSSHVISRAALTPQS